MGKPNQRSDWVGRGDVRAKAGNLSGRKTYERDVTDISGIMPVLRTGSGRMNDILSREADLSEWSNLPGRRIRDNRPVWFREDSKGNALFDRTSCGRSNLYDSARRRDRAEREPDLTQLLRDL